MPGRSDAFGQSRQSKRTNRITIILVGTLAIGLLLFLLSSRDNSISTSSIQGRHWLRSKDPAPHALSPASLPFVRVKPRPGEVAAPPPVVHYHMNNVTTSSDPVKNRETVLILTPLARFYQGYWDNLVALSYPHDLISLGFIIPRGREGNAAAAKLQEQIKRTQRDSNRNRFASIVILRQEDEPPIGSQSESARHALSAQKVRRASMAKARNSLLFTTLGPTTSWVLWLDSDIIESPATLIQDLASHNKPIIVPNCYQRWYNSKESKWDVRAYDFNSWQESERGKEIAAGMGPDDIILEGYAEMATYRALMAYMTGEFHDLA